MPYRVVWPEARRVEIEEHELRPAGPGEVQLSTAFTLISPGTERGWLTNAIGFPDAPGFRGGFPFHPGYSFAGVVDAVGAGVEHLAPGDRVVSGHYGWGCHSSHVTFPAELVTRVPDGVPLDEAVWFGLGDVALFSVRRARLELGESVLVMGQGPIGLLCVQLARWSGALPVVASDLDDGRLELAGRIGADAAVRADGPLAELAASLPGGGFDVVLELTARREPLDQALELVRPRGRVIMVSADANPYTANLHQGLFAKGASLTGVFGAARPMHDSQPGSWTPAADLATFLGLVGAGRLDVRSLTTDRYAAREARAAYERLLAGDPSMIGAVLDW